MSKLWRALRRVTSRLPPDPRIAPLARELAAEAAQLPSARGPLVVFQGVEEPMFFGVFAAIALELRRRCGVRGSLLLVRSINGTIGTGWMAALARSTLLSWLVTSQWARVNRPLVGPVAYRSKSLAHPVGDLLDLCCSWVLWRRLVRGADATAMQVDGIQIGDLVIDSYLRFRPAPQFCAGDRFTWAVLWQALRDLRRARRYFARARPAMYIASYSTYIEHGIAARVALASGAGVRVFGNFTTFGKSLSPTDTFHTPDTSGYRQGFEQLADQPARLAEAERHLAIRLSGGIDAATSYMKVSAYASGDEAVPDVAGCVVVFLHDFYDSPHVYADLIFEDFWAWISCTMRTLGEAGIPFWIKPHPNQIELSDKVLDELRAAFPDVRMLSSRVTNSQLAQAGIIAGVTVYGTVAHELAYLGIPTIACARHPHHSFALCRTARSIAEYQSFLRDPRHMVLDADEMRRQALAFYYMHNLFGSVEQLTLRREYIALWKTSHDESAAPWAVAEGLRRLRALPGWQDFIATLASEVHAHAR